MRVGLVLILLAVAVPAIAADPPGGPGWYQLEVGVIAATPSGNLIIAAGTPGLLVSYSAVTGKLRIRFERGVATWLGREVTTDGGFGAVLTVDVDPGDVRAFVKQPLSKASPTPADTAGNPNQGIGGPFPSGAGGGTGVTRTAFPPQGVTTVLDGAPERVLSFAPPQAPPLPPGRSAADVIPPASSAPGGGAGGGTTRMIAREEHDAWLAKILRLWGEDGARCETKDYGPGWVSICEPQQRA